MTDSLRDRIAALLEEHRQIASSCECGFDLGVSAITWRWRDHVADAVIRELRLSTDRGVIIGCDGKCATDECGCPHWGQA